MFEGSGSVNLGRSYGPKSALGPVKKSPNRRFFGLEAGVLAGGWGDHIAERSVRIGPLEGPLDQISARSVHWVFAAACQRNIQNFWYPLLKPRRRRAARFARCPASPGQNHKETTMCSLKLELLQWTPLRLKLIAHAQIWGGCCSPKSDGGRSWQPETLFPLAADFAALPRPD